MCMQAPSDAYENLFQKEDITDYSAISVINFFFLLHPANVVRNVSVCQPTIADEEDSNVNKDDGKFRMDIAHIFI